MWWVNGRRGWVKGWDLIFNFKRLGILSYHRGRHLMTAGERRGNRAGRGAQTRKWRAKAIIL